MKAEDFLILGAAGFAVWAILRLSGVVGGSSAASSDGSGFTLADLVSQGRIGAYIPTAQETKETGVTAGSLFNTGMGGGYATSGVTMGSLFNTGEGGGYQTLWNPSQPLIGYTSARDR